MIMYPKENLLNILVVEDNQADFFLIENMLASSTMKIGTIYQASRVSEARNILLDYKIGLIFLDLSLPDSFGMDSFLQVTSCAEHIPIIILTGHSESTVALEALQLGAQDYLVKGEFNTALLVKSAEYGIERKKAEEKIFASEKNYRQMFYKNPFPAWIYNLDTLQIIEVNDAAIQTYGYERNEFLKLTVEDVRLPQALGSIRQPRNDQNENRRWQKVWMHKKKNGEVMYVEVTFYQINYFGQSAMQTQMNDVTEKLLLEEKLELEQTQRQQQVAEAILKTQDEERKKLGAELHDNINQILATSQLYITAGLEEEDLLNDMINKGRDCIVMAIEEIRKLSKALITPVLISSSLKKAIQGMTGDIAQLKKINITTHLDSLDETMLSEVLKITIYRIAQEQLNNILKYADASEVTITVKTTRERIMLLVADNGKGFDTTIASKGVGLVNIQNRAALFNGRVNIVSSPGNGCTLKVELPTKNANSQIAA
jgi:two-component system sensor histidine kinase UhpB